MTSIPVVYTGSTSAKKIREISKNKSVYHTKDQGLRVFQSGQALSFRKGDVVVIWENGKITKEKDDCIQEE